MKADVGSSSTGSVWTAVGIGLLAGGLSGLFGVGGGILIVPALVILARLEQRLAHGTSLAATALLAASGAVGFAVSGQVDWLVAALLFGGSAIGALIGTSALRHINQTVLRYGFSALLLLTALRMLWDVPEATGRTSVSLAVAVGLAVTGLFSGTIAGLMGVGGGIIMVPAQMLLFGIPGAIAKGTSLAVIVPTALVGTQRNWRYENLDVRTALVVGLSGTVTSFFAARVAIGLSEALSAILFAGLLAITAIRLVVRRQAEVPVESDVGA